MADRYKSFLELSRHERRGRDFCVRSRIHAGTVAVIAPHGGGIEPGTSEVADGIAGDEFSFYAFEGLKKTGNADLHITSARFDEPQCVSLLAVSPWVITIHGEASDHQAVFLGGPGEKREAIRKALVASAFRVEIHRSSGLQGLNRGNLCNRGMSELGVQLELSEGLRRAFFESLSRDGRQIKTGLFGRFVGAVRDVVVRS